MGDASGLTGSSTEELRDDIAANVRGGAALLAEYQAELGAPTGVDSDPADWFGAVARYSGSDVADAAEAFADEVFATIRDGASRTTDDGHHVTLDAQPELEPNRAWLDGLGLRALERPDGLECPVDISCEWLPAPFELRGDGTNVGSYGNHDPSNRPENQEIEYIIIHDAEGFFDTTTALAQDKDWVSWHYTLRSSDGHIAQHLKAKDVGQAGPPPGVGAGDPHRSSAHHRARQHPRHHAGLRSGHALGSGSVLGLGALLRPAEGTVPDSTPRTGLVTINPDFDSHQPAFTGCEESGEPCPLAGSSSVILYSEPSFDAPLVNDVGRCPDGPGTMHISDHCTRASAGQQYAIAELGGGEDGDWWASGIPASWRGSTTRPTHRSPTGRAGSR